MAQSRTRKLVEDLKALMRAEARAKAGLPPPTVRDEIPAARGVGYATPASSDGGSGSGLAFPLTEQAGMRTYYPDRYRVSTDGLFSFAWAPVKQAEFMDNSGAKGKVNYIDPDA